MPLHVARAWPNSKYEILYHPSIVSGGGAEQVWGGLQPSQAPTVKLPLIKTCCHHSSWVLPHITWPIAGQCIFICQCHQPNIYNEQACCREWGSWMTSVPIAMCTCTGVLHNSCNPHGLMLRFMSLMHLYTCKCLLNTLGRAVQQLTECLAKETKSALEVKVQQHAMCIPLWIFNKMT